MRPISTTLGALALAGFLAACADAPVGHWVVPAGTDGTVAMDFVPGPPITRGDQTDIDEFEDELHANYAD